MNNLVLRSFLILFIYSHSCIIFGQISYEIILDLAYKDSTFNVEIDNSGIYGVSHFEINNNKILLYDFNKPLLYEYENNILINKRKIEDESLFRYISRECPDLGNSEKTKYNDYPLLENRRSEKINIERVSKSELRVSFTDDHFKLSFPGDLAYADLIGVSDGGIYFLLIERYLQKVPLIVSREIYTADREGNIFSILKLPNIKYLYTLKDLDIDEEGNLYHLLTTENGVQLFKWTGLEKISKRVAQYPENYQYSLHYNSFLATGEVETVPAVSKSTAASRPMSLRIAEGYVYHKYYCRENNLAPSNVSAPDGDIVRTPSRLVVGMNARVPYKWGGFNTLNQFDMGISTGKYAGDIHTDGVSSSAVGVDCSGFVSRCWQLSYHASTAYMPNITTLYSNWTDLKPGDAVHKVGHVRLYVSTEKNGKIKIVESTSRGWGVSYWSYAPSDLTNYSPRYYNEMSDDYFENQPQLLSVVKGESNEVEIKWDAADPDVLGYRLYRSEDRKSWTLIYDENTLGGNSVNDTLVFGTYYYRLSSVKNNPPFYSESDLSNEMAIGLYSSEKRCLLVDGFDRESGSWRGDGHKFVGRYGSTMQTYGIDFESRKSRSLFAEDLELSMHDYLFWISGDESTEDETLNSFEQSIIKEYLEGGGSLFISGSEIGWDLENRGNTNDKSFYKDYLKADYIIDDAGAAKVNGTIGSAMDGRSFQIGQTYDEDYPDEIASIGGSSLCMKYSNDKGAGIQYSGIFGNSTKVARLIYFGFPLETTADNTEFNLVIKNAIEFFDENIVSTNSNSLKAKFSLSQNYPNPFNPLTTIKYSLKMNKDAHGSQNVELKVFDILGEEVTVLVNKKQPPGDYQFVFNGSKYTSGVYFYQLRIGNFQDIKKMVILR